MIISIKFGLVNTKLNVFVNLNKHGNFDLKWKVKTIFASKIYMLLVDPLYKWVKQSLLSICFWVDLHSTYIFSLLRMCLCGKTPLN